MEFKLKRSLLAVCIATGLLLSGCGDDNNHKAEEIVTAPEAEPESEYRFVAERPYTADVVEQAGSTTVMDYTMKNVQGETITTSAIVFFPKTAMPEGGIW